MFALPRHCSQKSLSPRCLHPSCQVSSLLVLTIFSELHYDSSEEAYIFNVLREESPDLFATHYDFVIPVGTSGYPWDFTARLGYHFPTGGYLGYSKSKLNLNACRLLITGTSDSEPSLTSCFQVVLLIVLLQPARQATALLVHILLWMKPFYLLRLLPVLDISTRRGLYCCWVLYAFFIKVGPCAFYYGRRLHFVLR